MSQSSFIGQPSEFFERALQVTTRLLCSLFVGVVVSAPCLFLAACAGPYGTSLPSDQSQAQQWQEAREQLSAPDPIAMARLEPFVGQWDWDVRVWPFPESEPQIANGRATMTMVADGRFLKIDYQETAGAKNWGTMFLGFDRGSSLYQLVSFGTTSSAMTVGWGVFDRATWKWDFDVAFTDPITRKEAEIKLTVRRPRLDRQIWTAWRRDRNGQLVRWSETQFTKQ